MTEFRIESSRLEELDEVQDEAMELGEVRTCVVCVHACARAHVRLSLRLRICVYVNVHVHV